MYVPIVILSMIPKYLNSLAAPAAVIPPLINIIKLEIREYIVKCLNCGILLKPNPASKGGNILI